MKILKFLCFAIVLVGSLRAQPGPVVPSASQPLFANKTYVDQVKGSDSTGAVGRIDKPFATIKAAHDACVSAGGQWLVHINPGSYTDVGMTSDLVSYYFEPNTVHTMPAGTSTDAFACTGSDAVTTWGIYGFGNFKHPAGYTGTGRTVYISATNVGYFAIKALSFYASGNQPRALIHIDSAPASTYGQSEIDVDTLDAQNGGGVYGSIFFNANGQWNCRGMRWTQPHIERATVVYMDIQELNEVNVAQNAFVTPIVNIRCIRGLKGTGAPGLTLRRGYVDYEGPEIQETSNNFPNIAITCQQASEANQTGLTIRSALINPWDGGNSNTYPAIQYPAFTIRFTRLYAVHFDMKTSSAYTINAGGVAQTIDVLGGGISSNRAFDPLITFKGAPVTIDTSYFTSSGVN